MIPRAEILGYCLKNGQTAFNYNFYAVVNSQTEIEAIRAKLLKRYNKILKPDDLGDVHEKKIDFILRQLPGNGFVY